MARLTPFGTHVLESSTSIADDWHSILGAMIASYAGEPRVFAVFTSQEELSGSDGRACGPGELVGVFGTRLAAKRALLKHISGGVNGGFMHSRLFDSYCGLPSAESIKCASCIATKATATAVTAKTASEEAAAEEGSCDECCEAERDACINAYMDGKPDAERAFDFDRDNLDRDASSSRFDSSRTWCEYWDEDGDDSISVTQDDSQVGGGGVTEYHYSIAGTTLEF